MLKTKPKTNMVHLQGAGGILVKFDNLVTHVLDARKYGSYIINKGNIKQKDIECEEDTSKRRRGIHKYPPNYKIPTPGDSTIPSVDRFLTDHSKYSLSIPRDMNPENGILTKDNYRNILSFCTTAKDAVMARYVYLCLRSDGISPDREIFNNLIKTHVITGDISSAFAIFRKMEKDGIMADVEIFNCLIDGLLLKGYVKDAWRLYSYVRSWRLIEPDEHMLTSMIKASLSSKEAEKAIQIYQEMIDKKIIPNGEIYECLMNCFCLRADYAHRCLQIYDSLKSAHYKITPTMIAHALMACGFSLNTRKAKEVLKDAKDMGLSTDERILSTGIGALIKEFGASSLDSMHKLKDLRRTIIFIFSLFDDNSTLKTPMLNALIVFYENIGYSEYALDVLYKLTKLKECTDSTVCSILMRILERHVNEPGKFFTLYDKGTTMTNPNRQLLTLALEMSVKANSPRRAIETMEEMHRLEILPTPELTGRLFFMARRKPEMHAMIHKLVSQERNVECKRVVMESELLYTYAEERKLQHQ